MTLLARARAAGLAVALDAGELIVRGPRRLAALAEELLRHAAEVRGDLEAEAAHRAAPAAPAADSRSQRVPPASAERVCPKCGNPFEDVPTARWCEDCKCWWEPATPPRAMAASPDVGCLRVELALHVAAGEAAIRWRETAMRAQVARVAPGENLTALRARTGPFPFRACQRRGRALCESCGEPTRFAGGRCDPCFAAALRVVSTNALVTRKGRQSATAPTLPHQPVEAVIETRACGSRGT